MLSLVVGLAGVDPRTLFRRWLGFLGLVLFLAIMVAPGHPERQRLGVVWVGLAILAKNSLAFLAMVVLVSLTTFPSLLNTMGRLGLPRVLVATLLFMERQVQILSEELARMVQARRARTFRRDGRLDHVRLAGLIGMLLLRSYERGERVHSAMLARGWDGIPRTLEGSDER